MPAENPNQVKAIDRAVDIIDAVKTIDSPGVSDVADQLDMPASTVHNHLTTLCDNDFLAKSAGGTYQISYLFLGLGEHRRQQSELYNMARDRIDDLSEETADLVNLVVLEHDQAVYIYCARGEQAVQLDVYPGLRTDLHCTSSGKVLLANLPDEKTRDIVERNELVEETENTITDRDELYAELDRVREQGYALDREERVERMRCVAAPVISQNGELVGAISVSGPVSRLDGRRFTEELPEKIVGTADVISIDLEFS